MDKSKMKLVAGGLIGGTAAALAAGNSMWKNRTQKELESLKDASSAQASPELVPEVFTEHLLEELPGPVKRYLEFALSPGQRIVKKVAIEEVGKFRILGAAGESEWSTLKARQFFTTSPPGFVWDASVHTTPLLPTRVRDTFSGERGGLQAKVAGLVTIAKETESTELASGQLQRYLSEAVWFPTALIPGQGVTWEGIDDRSARASIRAGGTVVSLDFTFGNQGEITSSYTSGRYRGTGDGYALTPWRTLYGQYRLRNGMKIPFSGEVEWIIDGERRPYCHLQIVDIDHEFASPRLAA